jgi:hypothetical protein
MGAKPYTVPDKVLSTRRGKMQPVLDGLADDPAEAPLLRSVLDVAARHPEPDTTTQGGSCKAASAQDIPNTEAPIPDGQYRVQVTLDLKSAHIVNSGNFMGTWTITVPHGTYDYTCWYSVDAQKDCGESGADPSRYADSTRRAPARSQRSWHEGELRHASLRRQPSR